MNQYDDSDSHSHYIRYDLKGKIPDYYKNENTRIFIDKNNGDNNDDDEDIGEMIYMENT